MNIKLLLADDHILFKSGLIELLRKYHDMEVVGGVDTGQELLDLLADGLYADVVLLDLSMPEMSGFDVLKILGSDYPHVKALVISMHDDGNYIAQCARSGAYGYLLKNTDEDELIRAIRAVYAGKKYFNPDISEKMVNFLSSEMTDPDILSKKELEVVNLLAEGHTSREIARQLYISIRTVETHRANILRKLEVKNTAELIRKASELGLV